MEYRDLYKLKEDERIARIAAEVEKGGVVAVVTDSDPGKADRYLRKLQLKVKNLEVVGRFDGPVANTVTIQVRKRA